MLQYVALFIIMFFLALAAGACSYWIFQQVTPNAVALHDVMVDAAEMPTDHFIAGQDAYLKRTLYVSYDAGEVLAVFRLLERVKDGEIVFREQAIPAPPPLGESTRLVKFHIPDNIATGRYRLRTLIRVQLNPLRDDSYELLPSPEFDVVNLRSGRNLS